MNSLIIGNISSLLAMITDAISSSRKTARGVLFMQTISQLIYTAGSIILRGYSAAVQNVIGVVRNLLAMSGKDNKYIEWLLIVLGVVLGLAFNNRGIYGWLPVLSNLEYSLAVFKFKNNERALKIAFAISIALYAMFNIVLLNFVGFASNMIIIVTTILFVVKDKGREA